MREQHTGGMGRRTFLQIGGGICGLGLSGLLESDAQAKIDRDTGKSAIFIFLGGGQSHHDTWDLKPDAPEDVRGEFKPIQTNNPGLLVSEHMPQLAKQADKYTVLRTAGETVAVHDLGCQWMFSGNRPIPSLSYPSHGSVVAKELASPKGIPSYIRFPLTGGRVPTAGYLGVTYKSFAVQGDPNDKNFNVRALSMPGGLTFGRIEKRISFLTELDSVSRQTRVRNDEISGMDQFYARAIDVIRSTRLREAFDLKKMTDKDRDVYGRNSFGQACLLARRLVEVGVRFVGIEQSGWDTHARNFEQLKDRRLPPWDQGLAALLADLHQRGMLDKTAVVSTGEFGRTPTVNKNAGRDHWGKTFSLMMAGGGFNRGHVIGKTDAKGAEALTDVYSPSDIGASFLKAMGINHHKEYHTADGRPVLIVRDGKPIKELFA